MKHDVSASEDLLPAGLDLARQRVWLRRLARHLLDIDGAEDVVQETCIAALTHPRGAEQGGRAWLGTVLRNIVRKRWRAQIRRQSRERVAGEGAEEAAASPEAVWIRWEEHLQLGRMVGELGEPFRTTLVLRYFEDLSPAEIAHRLGVPGGTVRWRIKRALEELRRRLDAQGKDGRARLALLAWAPGRGEGPTLAGWGGALALATKTTSKLGWVGLCLAALVMVGVLLGLFAGAPPAPAPAAGQQVSMAGPDEREVGKSERRSAATGTGTGRSASRVDVPLPAFEVAPGEPTPADALAPARLLSPRAGALTDRRPGAPRADFAAVKAGIETRMVEARTHIERCLHSWSGDHPDLARKVMLVVEVDARGLADVWVTIAGQRKRMDELPRLDVSSGPLRCLSEGVYPVDWSGLTAEPATLTMPFGPGTDWEVPPAK